MVVRSTVLQLRLALPGNALTGRFLGADIAAADGWCFRLIRVAKVTAVKAKIRSRFVPVMRRQPACLLLEEFRIEACKISPFRPFTRKCEDSTREEPGREGSNRKRQTLL